MILMTEAFPILCSATMLSPFWQYRISFACSMAACKISSVVSVSVARAEPCVFLEEFLKFTNFRIFSTDQYRRESEKKIDRTKDSDVCTSARRGIRPRVTRHCRAGASMEQFHVSESCTEI